jgi:N-acetylneuraminate lyase
MRSSPPPCQPYATFMTLKLTGLVAAAVTPLTADGRLRAEQIDLLAELYAESGVSGVFACGTTGECHSLTSSERRETAARWVAAARERFPVIVHVGHNSLPEAQALARHADESGAAAIAAMAPFFFKPPNSEALIEYCAAIASAAPRLPFYYYHIPSMTGVSLPVAEFLKRAGSRIPNLAGAKFTHTDLLDFQECLAVEGGRYDILFGHDEILLAGLALGAKGAIGSTYNFAAPVYLRLLKSFQAGDLAAARHAQLQAAQMVQVLLRHGGVAACKAILQLMGLDCGPVRPPLATIAESQLARLREELLPFDIFARPLK